MVGRFINADGIGGKVGELGSHNIFAYCENNPIHRFDPIGQAWYDAICRGISTVLDMIFPGSKARAEKMMNSPSPYDCVNYITSGFADTAKGAFFPEEPLSAQHWIDSAATAAALVGLGAGISSAKTAFKSTKSVTKTVSAAEPFVPTSYWKKRAPKFGTPNTRINTVRLYNGKLEQSTVIYDFAGRQSIRVDWSTHGFSNHTNPHVHIFEYSKQNIYGKEITLF